VITNIVTTVLISYIYMTMMATMHEDDNAIGDDVTER